MESKESIDKHRISAMQQDIESFVDLLLTRLQVHGNRLVFECLEINYANVDEPNGHFYQFLDIDDNMKGCKIFADDTASKIVTKLYSLMASSKNDSKQIQSINIGPILFDKRHEKQVKIPSNSSNIGCTVSKYRVHMWRK